MIIRPVLPLLCLVCAMPLHSAEPAPYDSVLTVYWLTSQQEAQFSGVDGQISPFWSQWQSRDSLVMTVTDASVLGWGHWDGPTDACLTLKAAGGRFGLYFLLELSDDMPTDTLTCGFRADMLSVYIDSLSSQAIRECSPCRLDLPQAVLTYTSKFIRFWRGNDSSRVIALDYAAYNPSLWSVYPVRMTTEVARQCYGITLEEILPTRPSRRLELSFSWSSFGRQQDCLPVYGTVPASGSRSAFTLDYIDKDSPADSGRLAWRGATPWDGYYWGDLEFGLGFPAVPIPAESLLAVTPRAYSSRPQPTTASTSSYYLTGRLLPMAARLPKSAVFVRATPHMGHFFVVTP